MKVRQSAFCEKSEDVSYNALKVVMNLLERSIFISLVYFVFVNVKMTLRTLVTHNVLPGNLKQLK